MYSSEPILSELFGHLTLLDLRPGKIFVAYINVIFFDHGN